MLDLSYQVGKLGELIGRAHHLQIQVGEEKIHINDLLKTFCSAFLDRQLEYAKSVRQLIEQRELASAALIARSMLEGAACFRWVMKSEHAYARAKRWREHVYNESLKVSDVHEERNKDLTNLYDIKREAERLRGGERTFREYRWTVDEQGVEWKAREVIEDLVADDLQAQKDVYDTYIWLSTFTHWSPSSFSIDGAKLRSAEWALMEFPTGVVLEIIELAEVSLYHVASLTAVHFGFEN